MPARSCHHYSNLFRFRGRISPFDNCAGNWICRLTFGLHLFSQAVSANLIFYVYILVTLNKAFIAQYHKVKVANLKVHDKVQIFEKTQFLHQSDSMDCESVLAVKKYYPNFTFYFA